MDWSTVVKPKKLYVTTVVVFSGWFWLVDTSRKLFGWLTNITTEGSESRKLRPWGRWQGFWRFVKSMRNIFCRSFSEGNKNRSFWKSTVFIVLLDFISYSAVSAVQSTIKADLGKAILRNFQFYNKYEFYFRFHFFFITFTTFQATRKVHFFHKAL